jgi:hypothetical protein
MKREAITHTKMRKLCRRMDLATWQAIGLLDSIWLLTARETPRGDVGKLSDEDIALGIDYRGNSTAMVQALAETGWIDVHPEHRYVIHDWADHCEDSVHMRLARSQQFFADGRQPKLTRLPGKEKETAEAFYKACARTTNACVRPDSVHTPDARRASHLDLDHHQDQDPALTPPVDRAARGVSFMDQQPGRNGSAEPSLPSTLDDDDQNHKNPTEELKARFLRKTGEAITIELLDAIRSNLGGEVTEAFARELRKHNGQFKNYPGFVRDLSAEFRFKTTKAGPAPVQSHVLQREEKCPREGCGQRPGEGLFPARHPMNPTNQPIACPCATPEFVARMVARGVLTRETLQ